MGAPERDRELAEAVRLREQGSAEDARRILLRLAERLPDDVEIAYQAAWVHDVLGLEAEAVPYYERALAGDGLPDSDRCDALLGLGSTYRVLGRYEDAERTLRRGTEEFPAHGGLRAFLAMALFNTGSHEESVRLLLELLAATSEDPSVRRFRRAIDAYAKDLTGTVG
ncbi:tetratricopeptide repeat protein [Streptomyces sp. MS2.AVA.5]|uniref:Tetratricopeptide repeat protein n=1 Tax=Streptomyces achmelvichensis TaxID=3134111 RepID=A0ACC6Q208_9ACTN